MPPPRASLYEVACRALALQTSEAAVGVCRSVFVRVINRCPRGFFAESPCLSVKHILCNKITISI